MLDDRLGQSRPERPSAQPSRWAAGRNRLASWSRSTRLRDQPPVDSPGGRSRRPALFRHERRRGREPSWTTHGEQPRGFPTTPVPRARGRGNDRPNWQPTSRQDAHDDRGRVQHAARPSAVERRADLRPVAPAADARHRGSVNQAGIDGAGVAYAEHGVAEVPRLGRRIIGRSGRRATPRYGAPPLHAAGRRRRPTAAKPGRHRTRTQGRSCHVLGVLRRRLLVEEAGAAEAVADAPVIRSCHSNAVGIDGARRIVIRRGDEARRSVARRRAARLTGVGGVARTGPGRGPERASA
jgi:hypothetical protein